jgi:hypothetical protein
VILVRLGTEELVKEFVITKRRLSFHDKNLSMSMGFPLDSDIGAS